MTKKSFNITNEIKVNFMETDAHEYLSEHLKKIIEDNTIVVCIGTDRCIGDSLGPIVGTLLKKAGIELPVYGTLKHPLHAVNLREEMNRIFKIHKDPHIIAVDACLGEENLIGSIQIRSGPIFPGKGVGKSLPSIGDSSIVGIVDKFTYEEFLPIHNIRLSLVMSMAEVIAEGIIKATDEIKMK